MIKIFAVIGILAASLSTEAEAQARDPKFVAGIRSGLITGTMALSGVDLAFDNLTPDGPQGPHMSGFFFLVNVRPHLRLGFGEKERGGISNFASTYGGLRLGFRL